MSPDRIPALEVQAKNLEKGLDEIKVMIREVEERVMENVQWDRQERSRQHDENVKDIRDLQRYKNAQEGSFTAIRWLAHLVSATIGVIVTLIGVYFAQHH